MENHELYFDMMMLEQYQSEVQPLFKEQLYEAVQKFSPEEIHRRVKNLIGVDIYNQCHEYVDIDIDATISRVMYNEQFCEELEELLRTWAREDGSQY